MVFKYINNLVPGYLANEFKLRSHVHDRQTRSSNTLDMRSRKEPGRDTTEKPCGFAARFRGFAALCSRAQIALKIA